MNHNDVDGQLFLLLMAKLDNNVDDGDKEQLNAPAETGEREMKSERRAAAEERVALVKEVMMMYLLTIRHYYYPPHVSNAERRSSF